jgi:hypothetical protein
MALSTADRSASVPRRLPVGATYVVEGYGGGEGKLRVIARYLVLPDGNRINLRGELSQQASGSAPRAQTARRRSHSKQSSPKRRSARAHEKFSARRGTP